MRNFLQDGNMIRVAAPYAVATGDGCQVGAMFGLAGNAAAIGEILDLITIGEMRFTALSTDTGAVGTAMYWDNTNRRLTTTADAWVSVGVLTQAKTSGQTTAVIRLGMGHQASNSVLTKRDPVTGGVGMVLPGANSPIAAINTVPTLSSPYRLRKFQAALAKMRAGTANAFVAFVGDSITMGACSNGTTSGAGQFTNVKVTSFPTLVAAQLVKAGLNASTDSFVGDNGVTVRGGTVPVYDPRIAEGANWTYQAITTPGGTPIANVAGSLGSLAAETLTFTPANAFTNIDIYWYRTGSVGTCTVDIGGGVLATLSSGATGLVKTQVTGLADTTHVINLIRTVLGSVLILGVVAYRSTTKAVNLLNMGNPGSTSATWNDSTGAYSPLPALGTFAPDLTIINLGTNDWGSTNNLTQAQTITALTALVTKAQLSGDVLLIVPSPSATSYGTAAQQAITISAIYAVAQTMGVAVLDLTARWESYTVSNALGYYAGDGIHPLAIGQQDIAQAVAQFILSA